MVLSMKKDSHMRSSGSPGVRVRSPGIPEITRPNVSPVKHGYFSMKLFT